MRVLIESAWVPPRLVWVRDKRAAKKIMREAKEQQYLATLLTEKEILDKTKSI